jgi:hypothetical protein
MNEQTERPEPTDDPKWLDEFQDLANRTLGDPSEGGSCEQVHPVVADWYEKLMESEPPTSRDSILQAMACLSTEVAAQIPDDIFDKLEEIMDEDELVGWVEYVLMVGRAFEISLRKGEFDDL